MGRPIIINGGNRFSLANQRKFVMRSKSCMVIRGEFLKASSDVTTSGLLMPLIVSMIINRGGRTHSSCGSFTTNSN